MPVLEESAHACEGFNGEVLLWEARAFAKAVAAHEIASVRLSFRACLFIPPVITKVEKHCTHIIFILQHLEPLMSGSQ